MKFSTVFENKLNKVFNERDAISRYLSHVKINQLSETPIRGNFDLTHFAKIHRLLFEDVSSFAGVVRSYGIQKINGPSFAEPHQLPYLFDKELPQRLKALNASVNDRETYAANMAELHSTLDLAHPFRDGNGRTTRIFMEQLASEHGYVLNFEGTGREAFIDACQESIVFADETKKIALFKKIVQLAK